MEENSTNEKNFNLVKRTEEKEIDKVFKKDVTDYTFSVAKAGISLVPIVGSFFNEIMSQAGQSLVFRRLKKYLSGIDDRLSNLEKESRLQKPQLINNDDFIDIAIRSSQIAITTSKKEKLEALQNIVINTALQTNIDSDSKFMYLNFIDELTPIQIKLIKILMDPGDYIEQLFQNGKKNAQGSIVIDVLKDLQQILNIDKVFYDVSIKRLETDGIIDLTDRAPGPPIGGYDENSWFVGKTELERRNKNLVTDVGKIFVKFSSKSELEQGSEKHV